MKTIKNILFTLFTLALLFGCKVQDADAQYYFLIKSDSVGNAVNKTGTWTIPNEFGYHIDSVGFVLLTRGEIDIDTVRIKTGFSYGGIIAHYQTSYLDTQIVTVNLDSGAVSVVHLSGLTLSGATLNVVNYVTAYVYPAGSGNEATENKFILLGVVYYHKT